MFQRVIVEGRSGQCYVRICCELNRQPGVRYDEHCFTIDDASSMRNNNEKQREPGVCGAE